MFIKKKSILGIQRQTGSFNKTKMLTKDNVIVRMLAGEEADINEKMFKFCSTERGVYLHALLPGIMISSRHDEVL